MEPNKIYKFNQFETGLVAFISNFEKKIQNIIPEIPVFVLETGDETYWFKGKFETKKGETTEHYMKVPRVTLTIDEATLDTEQDTNQYTKIKYVVDIEEYVSQVRRKAITFPFKCSLVCSNFLFGLSYLEILITILSIDNTFTYDFLGNTYHGNFNSSSFSLDKTPMENGGTKNFIINVNIDVQLQPMIIRYDTIQNTNDIGPKKNVIGLETNDNLGDIQLDIIDTEDDEDDED